MVVSLFLLPTIPPSPATHSRVSAGMCSLSLRDFMARPGPRVHGQVPMPPLCPPSPARGVIRQGPTDADVGTAHREDAARGLGRRGFGGRALSASGRGSELRTCAQA